MWIEGIVWKQEKKKPGQRWRRKSEELRQSWTWLSSLSQAGVTTERKVIKIKMAPELHNESPVHMFEEP